MKTLDISVIILTKDEEIHIRRCLENARQFCSKIYVVDSFSTDLTVEIARELGAEVFQHKWENNYAKQFNWALDNCPITSKWILRLDADEYFAPETIVELQKKLPDLPDDITSLSLSRTRIWMGRKIKYGTGKIFLKRIFRYGIGHCEERLMDEHIVTCAGADLLLKGEFADDNLNDLSWWSIKHVHYAVREAVDLLNIEYQFLKKGADTDTMNKQAADKRHKKTRYAKLPLFWRAFAYFFARYILRGGFLEGREGFCWHFLQGLWYRMLVDIKVFEIKRCCGKDPERIKRHIQEQYNVALD